jgi:hypothetical protein
MESQKRRSWRDRLTRVYWVIVGVFGFGRPIVDRRSMYGDDPKNDPYNTEYDPGPQRRR